MARNQPPQRDVAPVVQRLRLQYAKRGRLRFSKRITLHEQHWKHLEVPRGLNHVPIRLCEGDGFFRNGLNRRFKWPQIV